MRKQLINSLLFIGSAFFPLSASDSLIINQVGVYYFPGWTESPGSWWNLPWELIKPFPEREPILSWYKEGDAKIAEQHLEWMSEYGIDFVVYDWYWSRKTNKPRLDHAIKAYLKSSNRENVKFCLMWANHGKPLSSIAQYDSVVTFWAKNYFKTSSYLHIDHKPVVYIFSPENLKDFAKKQRRSVKDLLTRADSIAATSGCSGIYFVACTHGVAYWVKSHIPEQGYSAMSAYNYHRGCSGEWDKKARNAESYDELTKGYEQTWKWILTNSKLPYFLPLSAGWDKRPWGSNKPHDNCHSTPESFREHLQKAKMYLDLFPEKTRRTVVICAWNEFGEGSYIEPTKKWGKLYLEMVKQVFGR